MNRLQHAIIAVLAAIACVASAPSFGAEAGAKPADVVTITIYNTGDLHDHPGNLPKIAGFIKQQKKKDPNVFFVDAGDVHNKGEHQMAATRGEGMMHIMSECGYDLCILGNHDYIYGKDRILDLRKKYPKFPLVLCNMNWSAEDKKKVTIPKYKIFQPGGVKLAIVGGGSHYKNHFGSPEFPMFHEREGLRNILPELKKKADLIVFVSHLFDGSDRNLINAWSNNAPPVIIGGHTHAARIWRLENTLIVKAGCWGRVVGKTTIKWDKANKKLVSTHARILKFDGNWAEDPAAKAAWKKYHRPKKK